MSDKPPQFSRYSDFWPYYLSQHSLRASRLVHVWGTMLALLALVKAYLALSFGWLVAAPVIGYGFAWIGHAMFEKNHPATFTYPLWSLRGDFDMLRLWLTGKLEEELLRHKIMT